MKNKFMKTELEEAAESYYTYNIFCDGITEFEHGIAIRSYIAGAKWMQERMYSEEEVLILLRKAHFVEQNIEEWFEQFKKK